jgi:hypothetical protein
MMNLYHSRATWLIWNSKITAWKASLKFKRARKWWWKKSSATAETTLLLEMMRSKAQVQNNQDHIHRYQWLVEALILQWQLRIEKKEKKIKLISSSYISIMPKQWDLKQPWLKDCSRRYQNFKRRKSWMKQTRFSMEITDKNRILIRTKKWAISQIWKSYIA